MTFAWKSLVRHCRLLICAGHERGESHRHRDDGDQGRCRKWSRDSGPNQLRKSRRVFLPPIYHAGRGGKRDPSIRGQSQLPGKKNLKPSD